MERKTHTHPRICHATLGLDTSTREPSFSVGLQGLRKEDVPAVEKLVMDTIRKVCQASSVCSYMHAWSYAQGVLKGSGCMYVVRSYACGVCRPRSLLAWGPGSSIVQSVPYVCVAVLV